MKIHYVRQNMCIESQLAGGYSTMRTFTRVLQSMLSKPGWKIKLIYKKKLTDLQDLQLHTYYGCNKNTDRGFTKKI